MKLAMQPRWRPPDRRSAAPPSSRRNPKRTSSSTSMSITRRKRSSWPSSGAPARLSSRCATQRHAQSRQSRNSIGIAGRRPGSALAISWKLRPRQKWSRQRNLPSSSEALLEEPSACRSKPRSPFRFDGNLGKLVDLSMTGAQVLTPAAINPNRLVSVTLPLGEGALSCKAKVAWSRLEPQSGQLWYRAGVQFIDRRPAGAGVVFRHASDMR